MKKLMSLLLGLMIVTGTIAQWKQDSLSTARTAIPVAFFNSKVVMGSSSGSAWDVYNLATNTHTSGVFSFARSDIQFARAGTKAYFAGGKYGPFTDPLFVKNIDVYNSLTDTWSVLNLSLARTVGGAGSVGNKVFFAGGMGRDFGGPMYIYNRVDIFNTTNGVRTIAKLSKARVNITVGNTGSKILFAGGWYWDIYYNQVESNVVDIYDNSTGVWSKALLSAKREAMAVAVAGNKILFAGGYTFTGASKNVDIYDAGTNTWITTYMSAGRYGMTTAVSGSKVYFAGGGGALNAIDVYDVAANTWSQLTLPVELSGYAATAIGDKIFYAGGYDAITGTFSDLVQIYNTTTNTWSTDHLSQRRYAISAASLGNNAVFAGGLKEPFSPFTYSNIVDFYKQPPVIAVAISTGNSIQVIKNTMSIYPNPAKDFVTVTVKEPIEKQSIVSILNLNGQIILQQTADENNFKISVAALKSGVYFCKINDGKKVLIAKFVKE